MTTQENALDALDKIQNSISEAIRSNLELLKLGTIKQIEHSVRHRELEMLLHACDTIRAALQAAQSCNCNAVTRVTVEVAPGVVVPMTLAQEAKYKTAQVPQLKEPLSAGELLAYDAGYRAGQEDMQVPVDRAPPWIRLGEPPSNSI